MNPHKTPITLPTRSSERVHGSSRDRQVVDDLGDGLPERQCRQPLGVERYHDRVARLGLDVVPAEPAAVLARDHAAVRTDDVDLVAIGATRDATALGDVILTPELGAIEMGGGGLHLADHRPLLLELGHDEAIAVAE